MFPLVPNLISEELNLIVALLIGIAFGFILEQAGFSSSRKLAGVFYGYDFTVLRVFFTAGVTAMSGVIILGYLGWLDTDFMYINPTFLQAAVLGGVIMGFGFIIGGFCPGTSVCGMAIGKIDAMVFVGGGLIGVFVYGELYPWFEGITNADAMGPLHIFDSLGMSQGLFAFALIAMAVGAFIATTVIERKVDPDGPAKEFNAATHRLAGLAVLAVGAVLVFLPDYKERMLTAVSDTQYLETHQVKEMTADELAFRLIDRDPRVSVIDVRAAADFASLSLPGAVNIEPRQVFQKEYSELLGQRHTRKVFVSSDEAEARKAALIARHLGYENVYVLCGGIDRFVAQIIMNTPSTADEPCRFQRAAYDPQTAVPPHDELRQAKDTERFRTKASVAMQAMIKEAKQKSVKPVKIVKKVAGGC